MLFWVVVLYNANKIHRAFYGWISSKSVLVDDVARRRVYYDITPCCVATNDGHGTVNGHRYARATVAVKRVRNNSVETNLPSAGEITTRRTTTGDQVITPYVDSPAYHRHPMIHTIKRFTGLFPRSRFDLKCSGSQSTRIYIYIFSNIPVPLTNRRTNPKRNYGTALTIHICITYNCVYERFPRENSVVS